MRHLSGSESPRYVSDRLSAVSNVPMQFLVSAGVVATILSTASLTVPGGGETVGFVDAQQTAAVIRVTERNVSIGSSNGCHLSTSSENGPSGIGS
ncbi:hypothetical protein OHD62_11995 [Mesorhizobium sp. YC-39]|uniref:hypothetical protein n=1 Tax=unclassified Mesorhizobium TaxID=325217 RepID=UPI0021E7E715|nr:MULTISPECIES: hypothetical protein [unclassified Mesorhizobium]MCV3207364.1 hypothetical protein [Mesorhizobium sp. YC-2]MCV3229091.1 hypothetical protein [Mesorhizobium sp. YC-39]